MSKRAAPHDPLELESKLDRIYSAISPDTAFAERLAGRLQTRAMQLSSRPAPSLSRLRSFWSGFRSAARWGVGLAALGLLVVLIVFSVRLLPGNPTAPAGGTSETPASSKTATPAAILDDLNGSRWVLTSLKGASLLEGSTINLNFSDGKMGGYAGCNAYGGDYALLENGALLLNEIANTERLCLEPEGVMEQESAYLETLRSASAYQVIDNQLEIRNAAGETILVYAGQEVLALNPQELVGTAWQLVSLDGRDLDQSTTISLSFADETLYGGHAGCRDYAGSYQARGDTIYFPRISMSGPDCASEVVMNQEAEYTDGLTWARNYRLEAGKLEIYTARDGVLVFVPLEEPFSTEIAPTPAAPPEQVISPQRCAGATLLEPASDFFTERPARVLGGGSVQTGDFSFELYLTCDPSYARLPFHYNTTSEIDGLGVYATWTYQGPDIRGETYTSGGVEPYLQLAGTSGPSLGRSPGREDRLGLQFPPNVIPDFYHLETPLRFFYQVETPAGERYGAALSFRLRPAADGYQPMELHVAALTEAELRGEFNPSPFPGRDWAEIHPLLPMIFDLSERWKAELLSDPGWRHSLSRQANQQEGWDLPGGRKIPKEYLFENWYMLDAQGLVIASVDRLLSPEGEPLQVSVYKDGMQRNLTYQNEWQVRQPVTLEKINFGFGLDAARAIKVGLSLDKQEITLENGATALEYVLENERWKWIARFDARTGQELSRQFWSWDASGVETLQQSTTSLAEERIAQPPQEILDYLK